MLRRPVALSVVEALYKSTMPKRKAKGEFFKPKKAKVEEESKGLEGSVEIESSKEMGIAKTKMNARGRFYRGTLPVFEVWPRSVKP
ncbi:50S ribosomal protein L9 domain protein [Oesophagostomum dentatum]|uniref:50S ribosomal protein L9 domain protein n=1 Tax=Oesophagostomum dentatum TaxID=61180 RepID=A0A0B1S9U7_OESDE|nr:50S ribosomal protein L9 domain protein [Oesophagostomum dentatum]